LEDGLAAAGLVLRTDFVAEGAYTFESAAACGYAMLQRTERPTAMFCANDEMAAGLLQAARRAHLRVPEDLSVVGFDDFQIAMQVSPTLTTVHSPIRSVGSLAASKLFAQQTESGSLQASSAAPLPTLVVRESSGPTPR
jgi:LacI family transcriptional regulator